MDLSTVGEEWAAVLMPLTSEPFWSRLDSRISSDRQTHDVYPPEHLVFRALRETPRNSVRVVILGQDPYHGVGQAEGLAFSVPPQMKKPPSLVNILRELTSDIGSKMPTSGSLLPWAQQGVLLLNCVLTVRSGEPGSHSGLGWETVTDRIVATIGESGPSCVFMLWGAYAQKKRGLIDSRRHLVLESSHPSPLSASRGFRGSRPFSAANGFLVEQGRGAIDWTLCVV